MRVLMIHPHDLLTIPWTIRIVKLAEALAGQGCAVTVCYIPNGRRRRDGISVRTSLPAGVRYVELMEGKGALLPNIRSVGVLAADADVVHVQKCFMTAALPALLAAKKHGLPLHYDWDDDETDLAAYWLTGLSRRKIAAYERMLPKLATTSSTVSRCLYQRALRFGAAPDDLFDVPVGVDLAEFDRLREDTVELPPAIAACPVRAAFVGHLEGGSYGELVVDEFAQVAAMRQDAGLIIVGGGSRQGELEAKVARLGLSSRVWFTGYVPHERVPAILARADIGIGYFPDTPYARAGCPVKILEYLAGGLAVVATAVGEVPRMIGDCGIAVTPESRGEIAGAVIGLVDDAPRRQRLKQLGRARVAGSYSWEKSAVALMAAYQRGISLRRTTTR